MSKNTKQSDFIIAGNVGTVPELSPIESLRWSIQDDGSYRKVSDINLLQNMDRIRKYLGEDVYRSIVVSMSKNSSRPVLDKSKLSDNQLLDTTTSRYLQSSSEKRAIVDNLISRYKGLVSDIQEKTLKEQQSTTANIDSSNSE